MNCVDAKRHLDLFLDGELDVETNLKVLEHLNLCTGCARTFEGERWLGGEVRRRLCEEKAPPALRGRICRALDRESGGRRWVRRASAAASVLVAAAVGYLLVAGPATSAHAQPVTAGWLAEAAARRHDEFRERVPANGVCVCPKCEAKPVEALKIYYGRSGACSCPHCLHEQKDYEFRSAGVWNDCVDGVCAAWTTQVAPSQAVISQSSLPSASVRMEGGVPVDIGGHAMLRFQVGPRVILMGRCGDRVCVLVVDSTGEADRLAAK